jgi:hypothetical protein
MDKLANPAPKKLPDGTYALAKLPAPPLIETLCSATFQFAIEIDLTLRKK